MTGFWLLVAIAAVGALASVFGGLIALWKKPTSLTLSISVGFAAGVLLGTFAFEMLPAARDAASVAHASIGFAAGFFALYLLDLFIHRGATAGSKAEQRNRLLRLRKGRRSRGDEITVLAGGTSAEELIEGIAIGVSAAADPSLGLMVGLAIAIDNVAESLSIGELVLDRKSKRPGRRILFWTSLIGLSLFVSALGGWLLLRDLSDAVLGVFIAIGAGGMFYLTVTDLVPEAESHHFNQSAAIAMAAGFLLTFALSSMA